MANRHFEFRNTGENLVPVLKQMLEFIQTELPAISRAERILFSAKVILTELLTNSLKHSGIKSTQLDVTVDDLNIVITKTDMGRPLSLINVGQAIPCKTPISNDILHTLYAITETADQLHFICEDNKMEDILIIDDIVEHFGLLIITKAADEFSYRYERAMGANMFVARIKLI